MRSPDLRLEAHFTDAEPSTGPSPCPFVVMAVSLDVELRYRAA